ncbi:SMC-Scp complex subunit ScpB [Candidatus Azambacteria bacterium RIFCSPHIGHO2_01_FULL_40_24]|uniref:SMC-Scp complex subunit ScpB n=1 Tax=Candidatus Azambacteria bacterium RIFCSPHIGHO2_01_FULL_40_24 TaxID=1797301 RepID=A0A1F5B581_9BACT|nr:MAG: SMC-Scp complex subunit ScpB [Candidatus Azambacteria bacterium RIFCSPHIGHO2_01_FULL_40_24]
MNIKSQLESLLFISGHPIGFKKLADILEIPEKEIEDGLNALANDYEKENRGLRLVFLENKAQLVSAPDSVLTIKKLIKSDFEEDLSSAALETLAIISYRGPISRAAIENLRGVNCSFILQSLAVRGLIDRKNNPEDGRSYIYSVTFDFLKHLGLNRLEDLPKYNDLYERK